MRKKIAVTLTHMMFLFLLPLCFSALGAEPARDYLEAVKLYNEGKFQESAALFETVAGQGVINGKLYYNIGNAYAKQGDVGHAMLWYERAMKLIPHDPDLIYNHTYVTGLLKDKVEEKRSPVYSVLFFWKDLLTPAMIKGLGLFIFLVFWIRVIVALLRAKRPVKLIDSILLIFALIFTLTSYYDYFDSHFHKKAVILSESVAVRSGLSDESTELFVLHSGTRIDVNEERRGYIKIKFSDDKIGWVKRADIEII